MVCSIPCVCFGLQVENLGSVRRFVVIHEVDCDMAKMARTESDLVGCVGCVRVTGANVERLVTKENVERWEPSRG